MYMCGRMRTASSPSSTLMLSAEYSPPAASETGRFSCEISNAHLSIGSSKYHAKSVAVKANGRVYLPENRLDSGRIGGRDPALGNAVESRLCSGAFGEQPRVGGGEHHLPPQLREVRHEEGVALRIELARDIVEKEQGGPPLLAAQVLDFADLERQHGRARLALARISSSALVAERDRQIVGMRAGARVAALEIAREAPLERLGEWPLGRGGGVLEAQLCFAAGHLGEGARGMGPQFLEDLDPPRSQPLAEARHRLVERSEDLARLPLAEEVIARAQRAQIIARVGEMIGMAVLHGAVEELPPPFRPGLDDGEIVGREGDGGEAAEELVRIAHALAVEPRATAARPQVDLHLARPAGKLKLPADARRLLSAAHQLDELLRSQRPQ